MFTCVCHPCQLLEHKVQVAQWSVVEAGKLESALSLWRPPGGGDQGRKPRRTEAAQGYTHLLWAQRGGGFTSTRLRASLGKSLKLSEPQRPSRTCLEWCCWEGRDTVRQS